MRRLSILLEHVASTSAEDGTNDSEHDGRVFSAKLAVGFGPSLDPCGLLRTPWAHRHIHWMAQKDALRQDMFLVGGTGQMRRWLALRFAEAFRREVDIVALTHDTTESDLKQRREIISGGSIVHTDQAVVKAALQGRILILEGLEKVERNVLPVLNNLLENREMHLEDGRFLVAPERYDALVAMKGDAHMKSLSLERVSPQFRVIALGVPVPPFPGNPLDPPLRSRFQARRVDRMPAALLLKCLSAHPGRLGKHESNWEARVQELVAFYEGVWELGTLQGAASGGEVREIAFEHLIYPSEADVVAAAMLLFAYPDVPVSDVVHRMLPVLHAVVDDDAQGLVSGILPPVGVEFSSKVARRSLSLEHVCLTSWQASLALRMQQSLAIGCNVLLLGGLGEGKSVVARGLCALENYGPVETLTLYKDMTGRDLLQSRTTSAQGETLWRNSCIAVAAIMGRVVLLDGVDRLAPGTLAVLTRLMEDREVVLFDGTQLISPSRLEALASHHGETVDNFKLRCNVSVVHPRFRIIALAAPPDAKNRWLTNELAHSFHTFALSDHAKDSSAREELLRAAVPLADPVLARELLDLAERLLQVTSDGASAAMLSMRNLIRILRRSLRFPGDVARCVADALLLDFLPPTERQGVVDAMTIWPGAPTKAMKDGAIALPITMHQDDGATWLQVGSVTCKVEPPEEISLVPDVVFFDIPMHTYILESMLKDFVLGDHVLLIGNQGVGKNKLTDRLLQLLQRERQYIQLHRDTTVQALTLLPSMQGGIITYDDSPLVKALVFGHVLVVDEFDKAPAEVVVILKGLLEDGEILLADGRRFVDPRRTSLDVARFEPDERDFIVQIHPSFRVLALANRPGFPFLGNDFFREMGDVFAVHAVPNPDRNSEVALLQAYAPHVPPGLVDRLVVAFSELRDMADQSLLSYPYSTREVVAIVRHMERFPQDSVTDVLENVFGFEFDPDLRLQLFDVFRRHGIPIARSGIDNSDSVDPRSVSQDAQNSSSAWKVLPPPEVTHRIHDVPVAKLEVPVSSWSKAERWRPGHLQYLREKVEDAGRWRPLEQARSARVDKFSEEIIGWNTGKDPIALASIGASVFVLLPSQEVRQYDLSLMRWRSYDLRLARLSTGLWRGFAATGDWVVSYEEQDRVAQIIQPFAEPPAETLTLRMDLFPSVAEPKGHVEVLPLKFPLAFVFYGVGGCCLVFFCPYSETMCQISLQRFNLAFVSVEVVGETALLVRTRHIHTSQSVMYRMDFRTLFQNQKDQTVEDIWLDLIPLETDIGELPRLIGSSANDTHAIGASSASVGGFVKGISEQCGLAYRVPRNEATSEPLLVRDVEGQAPFLRKRRAVAVLSSHSASGYQDLVCTVTSSPLGVVVEVTDLLVTELHSIVLKRTPQDHDPFIVDAAHRADAVFLRRHGMPHIVQACQIPEDGTLAILFTDGQVRVLEVRADRLAAGRALWLQMAEGMRAREVDVADTLGQKGQGDDDVALGGSGGGNSDNGAGGSGGLGSADVDIDASRLHIDIGTLTPGTTSIDPEEMARLEQEGERVLAEARAKAREAAKKQMQMVARLDGPLEEAQYARIFNLVQREIQQLRVVLQAAEAREQERVWLRYQPHGELDDSRLADGIAGERSIYKRRGHQDQMFGRAQRLPKRMSFVVDVSSSMAKMNGDGRLDRLAATVVMIMEAFSGMESKFVYDIVGHSGETESLEFVAKGKPPKDAGSRLQVIRAMYAHASGCMSGDSTLPATLRAIHEIIKEPADDHFVFVVSDANLAQYGVHPKVMAKALQSDNRVNAYVLFIAGMEQAEEVRKAAPSGRVFTVLDTRELPIIFRRIFTAAVLRDVSR